MKCMFNAQLVNALKALSWVWSARSRNNLFQINSSQLPLLSQPNQNFKYTYIFFYPPWTHPWKQSVFSQIIIPAPHHVLKCAYLHPPPMCAIFTLLLYAQMRPFCPPLVCANGSRGHKFGQHTCAQMCCPNVRKQAHFNGPVRKRVLAWEHPWFKLLIPVLFSQKYHSTTEALRGIVQQEGFKALFKGLTPTLVQAIPYGGCQFGFYAAFNKISTQVGK